MTGPRVEEEAMSAPMRWLRLGVLSGGLLLVYFVVPAEPRLPSGAVVARTAVTLLTFAVLGFLIVRQLRLEVDRGPDYRVDGLVASVMAVIVVFSLSYYILAERNPSQIAGLHTRIDALYFTVSTLATVGFGDVHTTGQAARVMVLLQMFFNVVFITTAATLLSGRIRGVAEQRSRARRGGSPNP
jgi:voltage-gated potassium channel